MGHSLKNFIKKAAETAQKTFEIDETKVEKFLQKSNDIVDKTAVALDQFEEKSNQIEGDWKFRLKNAKEALMAKKENTPNPSAPKAPTAKKSASAKKTPK